MKISISMATYNGERFLSEQPVSFAAQTRLPDELVVSDDSSSDATLDVLKAFAAYTPFKMRVMRQRTNLGYATNFDRALRACTGDLVFPPDQDDFWFAEKLAQLELCAHNTPGVAILCCDTELTNEALAPSERSKRSQISALGLREEATLPAFRGELANHRFLGYFPAVGQPFTLPTLQGSQGDPDHLACFAVTGFVAVGLFNLDHHILLMGFENQSSSGSVERVSSFF